MAPTQRILVVEAEATAREALARVLRETGQEVRASDPGPGAWALLASSRPAVLLVRIQGRPVAWRLDEDLGPRLAAEAACFQADAPRHRALEEAASRFDGEGDPRPEPEGDPGAPLCFVQDREGVVVAWHGLPGDLAMPPEAFLGRPLREVLPGPLAELLEGPFRRALDGAPQRVRYELDIPGRGPRAFEARLYPVRGEGVFSLIRDLAREA